jgi:hypothetical protein
MSRKWIIGAAVALALVFPGIARAHGGHTHKVMGTVSSVQGNHVEVKTTDGKTVMVMLNAKTAITRGKTKLDATAVKAGERVSIDAMQEKDMMMAQAVKLGTPTPAPAAVAKK